MIIKECLFSAIIEIRITLKIVNDQAWLRAVIVGLSLLLPLDRVAKDGRILYHDS